MEFQIDLPADLLHLAVIYFTGDGTQEHIAWWPQQLSDACRNTYLIHGRPATRLGFVPEQWAALDLATWE
jgi:hypothetical protein